MYWSRHYCTQWKTIICRTLENNSLERISTLAETSVISTFYYRHKVMYVLVQSMNEDILLVEAELDYTYINYQEDVYIRKGKRNVMMNYLLGNLALLQFRKKEPLFLRDIVLKKLFYRTNCIKTTLINKDICSGIIIYHNYNNFKKHFS